MFSLDVGYTDDGDVVRTVGSNVIKQLCSKKWFNFFSSSVRATEEKMMMCCCVLGVQEFLGFMAR